jgi:cytochrome c553
MNVRSLNFIVFIACVAMTAPVRAADIPPALAWAYGIAPDGPDMKAMKARKFYTVPGSPRKYRGADLDGPIAPDWFPDEHEPMPQAVRQHSTQDAVACANCHLTNGMGHKATASIAGLNATYILEQLTAFKEGGRRPNDQHQNNLALMIAVAGRLSPQEAAQAADYFAGLKPMAWVRVVESEKSPRFITSRYGWMDRDPKGGMIPLGHRIVELSEDENRMNLRDPHSGLIAYVPMGSIARGQALAWAARMGDFKCATCHGEGLTGSTIAPRLAGQMPSYLARQMWDIKTGARNAEALDAMKEILGGISAEQITDIAAYCASLDPR